MTINVAPVNDPPSGVSFQRTTLEDVTAAFAANDFTLNDPNDIPHNNLAAVQIVTLPAAASRDDVPGCRRTNPGPVSAGQFITRPTWPSCGSCRRPTPTRRPPRRWPPSPSRSRTTASRPTAASTSIRSPRRLRFMSRRSTTLRSAAIARPRCSKINAYTFTLADFASTTASVFDPNDTNPPSAFAANTLQAVKIATLPTAGTLTLGGNAVGAGNVIQAGAIASGQLKFTPAANANGANYASFTFQVQDNGGTANGGADLDPTAKTVTLNVTPVNDRALGQQRDRQHGRGRDLHVPVVGLHDYRSARHAGQQLASITILSLPAVGTLTLNGSPVAVNQVVLATDISGGNLQFTGAGQPIRHAATRASSSACRTTAASWAAAWTPRPIPTRSRSTSTRSTTLPPAPTRLSRSLEDGHVTFQSADFGFSDPNDWPPECQHFIA